MNAYHDRSSTISDRGSGEEGSECPHVWSGARKAEVCVATTRSLEVCTSRNQRVTQEQASDARGRSRPDIPQHTAKDLKEILRPKDTSGVPKNRAKAQVGVVKTTW